MHKSKIEQIKKIKNVKKIKKKRKESTIKKIKEEEKRGPQEVPTLRDGSKKMFFLFEEKSYKKSCSN